MKQTAKDLINWQALSRELASNVGSVRNNSVPKKYEERVADLKRLVEIWMREEQPKICEGCGHINSKPIQERAMACCPDSNYKTPGQLFDQLIYWKRRAKLAQKVIDENPCDPDITKEQMEAGQALADFIRANTGT